MGYKTLGLILEAIEDAPYREIVRRRVLAELGMGDTEPAITNEMRDRLAVGYEPARDDRPWAEGEPLAPATWLETGTADGCLASTGADMAAFLRFLMTDDSGLVARMAEPVPAREAFGFGYGLLTRTVDGRRYIGHGGGMVGYRAGMQWDPDAGIGAVVLQNGPGHNPNALARLAIRRARAVRDGRDPGSESMEGPQEDDVATEPGADGDGRTDGLDAVARAGDARPGRTAATTHGSRPSASRHGRTTSG